VLVLFEQEIVKLPLLKPLEGLTPIQPGYGPTLQLVELSTPTLIDRLPPPEAKYTLVGLTEYCGAGAPSCVTVTVLVAPAKFTVTLPLCELVLVLDEQVIVKLPLLKPLVGLTLIQPGYGPTLQLV
jgi:hypothetical protein